MDKEVAEKDVGRDPVATLEELRKRSEPLFHLVLVCRGARTLAEWADAQTAMAVEMERDGDLLDRVHPVHLGFVNGRRPVAPRDGLVARGQRLESALHQFCQTSIFLHEYCHCSDCESVRNFRLEQIE
jgi:hypothetical protein